MNFNQLTFKVDNDGATPDGKLSAEEYNALLLRVQQLSEGATYGGIVTPASNPISIEPPVFYVAMSAGTYTNFGGLIVADGEVAILQIVGNAWMKTTLINTGEFMASTPSGDPNHALYEALGATWDGSAWQYNGLTMSSADMASVLVARRLNVSNTSASINNATIYAGANIRTNVESTHYQPNNARYFGDGALLVAESKMEVLVLNSGGSGVCRFTNLRNAFYQATRLRKIVGILDLSQCTDFNFSFQYANNVEEVYIINTNGLPIRFNSTNISVPCLTYLVNNSGTATFTLTVPASVYSAAMADTDFTAALAAHTNVTFAQA